MATTIDRVRETEAAKYRKVWTIPEYRVKCHSDQLWQTHRGLFPATFDDAIDLGCGLGRLIARWNEDGVDAWGVDLVPQASLEPDIRARYGHKVIEGCLWSFHPGRVWDVGVCTDVMEHLPEEHVPSALDCIAACCRMVVFKIANFASDSTGQRLHLTQRPAPWWRARLWASMGGVLREEPYQSVKEEYVFTWRAAPS